MSAAKVEVASDESSLWRNAAFRRLWIGQTISQAGTQVTSLALPLTAVILLGAGPIQMGLLRTVRYAPFVLISLFAGVWVDRVRRRPVLLISDVGIGALLLSIPLAASLHLLRIEQLYLVGFLTGILTVFFEVAYISFVPSLVKGSQLPDANGKLEMSRSASQFVGPAVGGALIQVLTAPIAIVVDVASYLVSACFVWRIRADEVTSAPGQGSTLISEIREGFAFVMHNPLLRALAGSTGTFNLFYSALFAEYVLYATRDLGVTPALLGVVFAAGSLAALLGTFVATSIVRRIGLGATLIAALPIVALGNVGLAFASRSSSLLVPILLVGQVAAGVGLSVYNINQVSLRQAITPTNLMGRMNATMRFIVWGAIPIGSLLGGVLGETVGLRWTMALTVCGVFASWPWLMFSPVRSLAEHPTGTVKGLVVR